MKYILLGLVFLFNEIPCSTQVVEQPESCKCDMSAFTASNPNEPVRICLSKEGFTVITLNFPYGEENEESIFLFDVFACDEGWLKIKDNNSNGFYWIEPRSLQLTSRHDGFELFSSSNKRSTIYSTGEGGFLTILGCEGKWALVEWKTKKGEIIKGWLAPDDQCSNPFTTCP